MPEIQVDWDNFEFRCHYFGELMSMPKGKTNKQKYDEALAKYNKKYEAVDKMTGGSTRDKHVEILFRMSEKVDDLAKRKDQPTLSVTCMTRLAQIYTEQTTGRKFDINSIVIEKGLRVEEDSITLYSERTGNYYLKNRKRESNGYVNGEIDFEDESLDMTIDTKSNWDIFSFDKKIALPLDKNWEWQGHMYMWLRNRSRHRVACCLVNTPKDLVDRLVKSMRYSFAGTDEEYKEAEAYLRDKHNYDDLSIERRVRAYDFDRDDEKIDKAKYYIPIFRNYLKNITNTKLPEDDFET